MSAYVKLNLIYISIGFCPILGVESFSGGSNRTITVKPGGSVTIPCYYDEKNPPRRKYWFSEHGQSNKYTNTTEENLSVIDHPDQSLFTVTMRNLQENKHNGQYYCTVETGQKPNVTYVTYELYLKVHSAPDVSVMSSSVSGHEGGNVSVQCFYSSEYKKKLKRWCRYKDEKCFRKKTNTSQNSSVQISDDGENFFTVLMTGLTLSDSGWYYCSAGDQIVPVQLTVTDALSCAVNNKTGIELLTVWFPVSAALLLLVLLLAAVVIWIRRRKPKQDDQTIRQRNNSSTTNPIYTTPEDPVIYSSINDETPNDVNSEITYSTIDNIPGSEAPLTGGGLYSTVAPH
ncbi:polymeric immunoglobulin receptor isoform X2 [Danio rerio]|uniref:polymeric immunoglobulin receptor isoform X2 n=1 Tax=Danio rerio TaxID=7955 RepID=UPI003CE5A6C8